MTYIIKNNIIINMLYELLYIIPSPYTEKDLPNIQKSINKIIEENGGKITFEENWGNKKMAYPIKQIRRGFYILVNFEINPENLKTIEQKLKLMPEVLRFQIIKLKLTKKILRKPTEKTAVETRKKEEKLDLKTLSEKIDKLLEI